MLPFASYSRIKSEFFDEGDFSLSDTEVLHDPSTIPKMSKPMKKLKGKIAAAEKKAEKKIERKMERKGFSNGPSWGPTRPSERIPNMVSTAPASVTNVGGRTYFRTKRDGRNLHISGKDYLTKVVLTSGAAVGTVQKVIPLNPKNFVSTKLSTYASMYERFRFTKFNIHWVVAQATSASGAELGFYEMDPDDALPVSSDGLIRSGYAHFGHATALWKPTIWAMPPQTQKTQDYFVDPGDEPRLTTQAIFNLVIEETPSVNGSATLFIEYECSLFQEKWDADTINPGGLYFEAKTTTDDTFEGIDFKYQDADTDDGANLVGSSEIVNSTTRLVFENPNFDWFLLAIKGAGTDFKVSTGLGIYNIGTTVVNTDWEVWSQSSVVSGDSKSASYWGVVYRTGASRSGMSLHVTFETTATNTYTVEAYVAAMPILASNYHPPFALGHRWAVGRGVVSHQFTKCEAKLPELKNKGELASDDGGQKGSIVKVGRNLTVELDDGDEKSVIVEKVPPSAEELKQQLATMIRGLSLASGPGK